MTVTLFVLVVRRGSGAPTVLLRLGFRALGPLKLLHAAGGQQPADGTSGGGPQQQSNVDGRGGVEAAVSAALLEQEREAARDKAAASVEEHLKVTRTTYDRVRNRTLWHDFQGSPLLHNEDDGQDPTMSDFICRFRRASGLTLYEIKYFHDFNASFYFPTRQFHDVNASHCH